MGSPYEILKEAVLDAITYRNATIEMESAVSVNGELHEHSKDFIVNGDNGSLNYDYDKDGNIINCYYDSKSLNISRGYLSSDGTQWYNAYVPYNIYDNNYYSNKFSMIYPEDRDSAQVRFLEVVADALVGDLKNNITMSSSDGVRLIQGTLVESQIPEIVKAGIDMIIEQQGAYSSTVRSEYEGCDKLSIPMKSLVINYVHGEAEIDANGTLLSVKFGGTATMTDIFGDINVIEGTCNMRFTDIGTSAAFCPIPGAEELFTPEYMRNKFGNEYEYYGSVFFKLNEDGSIDESSVTTTYPGELENINDEIYYYDGVDTYYPSEDIQEG
jgi:hypothetical protein